jgi:hypothetical protein
MARGCRDNSDQRAGRPEPFNAGRSLGLDRLVQRAKQRAMKKKMEKSIPYAAKYISTVDASGLVYFS